MSLKIAVILFMALIIGISAWGVDYRHVKPTKKVKCLGETGYALADEFCRQIPKGYKIDKKLLVFLKKDRNYKEGNAYMYDPSRYINVPTLTGNPEKPNMIKKGERRIPNYKRALEYFHASVLKHGNPVSAYEGLNLLKSFFSVGAKKNMQMRRDFAKSLYEYKTCEGYLEWGDIYANGILQKVDKKKALDIYNKGYGMCRDIGLYGTVLGSRIERMKMELMKRK